MKKPHLIKLNHKIQVIDLGYTRARRRHRQQRGRQSPAPATQYQQRQQREHGENERNTRARRRHRQQRGRLSAAPATQIPAALQQRELCSTSKPLGKKQAMAPFLIEDTGLDIFLGAPGLTSQAMG